jgi:hypothetical protein
MGNFARWIRENTKGRSLFVSDNSGIDWQFINWYFWHFTEGADPHALINAESVNARLLVTYIIKSGEPRGIERPQPNCGAALRVPCLSAHQPNHCNRAATILSSHTFCSSAHGCSA